MPIMFTCPHCGRVTNVADQYAGQSGPCAGCGQTVTIPGSSVAPPFKSGMDVPFQPAPAKSTNAWVIVVIALAVMCLCGGGTLVALLLPAVQASREAARRMQCSGHLKQIGLALHNYHDVYKCFPAAYIADKDGKPMHSWRVALLPYLEHQDLYEQYNFDEPWDSPNNLAVAQMMPDVFRCPSHPSAPGSNLSNYVVIIGDPNQQPQQSLFLPNHWTKLGEVSDGTANTVMIVETSRPGPWTQPDADPTWEQFLAELAAGSSGGTSPHPSGRMVGFADGSVRFIDEKLDTQTLRLMLRPNDGVPVQPPDF